MGLLGVAGAGLRAAAQALESIDSGGSHGAWCDDSKHWVADDPNARVIPIRVSDEFIGYLTAPDGWQEDIRSVYMRPAGDGTFSLFFKQAEEVDLPSNRIVQRMLMTALDLAQSLDVSNCDLSDDVVQALGEFKRAARSRLNGVTQESPE